MNVMGLYATMSIDMKRKRVRLHRNILQHFNGIQYIQFLINVEAKQFAVRFLTHEASGDHTFKVNPRVMHNGNSYEVSCYPFIEKVSKFLRLQDNMVYRYTGIVIPAESMAVFNLNLNVVTSKAGSSE